MCLDLTSLVWVPIIQVPAGPEHLILHPTPNPSGVTMTTTIVVSVEFIHQDPRYGTLLLVLPPDLQRCWPQRTFEFAPNPAVNEPNAGIYSSVRAVMKQFGGQIKWVELRGTYHKHPGVAVYEVPPDKFRVAR